jgi:hypothetical protein
MFDSPDLIADTGTCQKKAFLRKAENNHAFAGGPVGWEFR